MQISRKRNKLNMVVIQQYAGKFCGYIVFAYYNNSPVKQLYEYLVIESNNLKICRPYNEVKNQSFGQIKLIVEPKTKKFVRLALLTNGKCVFNYKTKVHSCTDQEYTDEELVKMILSGSSKEVTKNQRDKKDCFVYTMIIGQLALVYFQNKTSQHYYENLKLKIKNFKVINQLVENQIVKIHLPPKQEFLLKLKKEDPHENSQLGTESSLYFSSN
eukprot:TRINITY_DN6124_c0_g1_i2.p2 TRINITY_DN6124_c0_g1~~TRINITY_DN6124_c0_g1_i2.p2  ORF type:complete len:215 (+),score=27.32 TRINITY_DN6124_c0_g1_i2:706-1350(+)